MLKNEIAIDTGTLFTFRDNIIFSRLANLYTDCLWEKNQLMPPKRVTPEYLWSELQNNRFGVFVVSFPGSELVAGCGGTIVRQRDSLVVKVAWEYFSVRGRVDFRLRKERAFKLRNTSLRFALDLHCLNDSADLASITTPDLWWCSNADNMVRYRYKRGVLIRN